MGFMSHVDFFLALPISFLRQSLITAPLFPDLFLDQVHMGYLTFVMLSAELPHRKSLKLPQRRMWIEFQ